MSSQNPVSSKKTYSKYITPVKIPVPNDTIQLLSAVSLDSKPQQASQNTQTPSQKFKVYIDSYITHILNAQNMHRNQWLKTQKQQFAQLKK